MEKEPLGFDKGGTGRAGGKGGGDARDTDDIAQEKKELIIVDVCV